ncbi:MAG: single-stranded-DNA-specific exonuclease RecJ, partial [Clostridia bacterium]|nr:single-stranded-DNA-specific exonuclease RecJ [Clostridia bacterium]
MLRLVPRITANAPDSLVKAGIPEQLARILYARGVNTPAEAHAFLSPSLDHLHDPFLLFGMDAAVLRIHRAVSDSERICVFGDYDVDGVCAVTVLVEALRAHGADVWWYIPSRHQEGYGLNADAVNRIAGEARLLITVDCGITSIAEAKIAKELSLDLIITDHHEPPETLPEAVAIVNPLLGAYPFRRLCGTGVAFKLIQALYGLQSCAQALELTALATVADLVPLLDENRILVSYGLKQIQQTRRAGLRALIHVAGLTGREITAGHLGFQLGPRINAGGRIEDASRSVTLMLTDGSEIAETIARELDDANKLRQRTEAVMLERAIEQAEQVNFIKEKAIIIVGEEWNTGIIGLVASRLTDKYAWPAIVFSETEGILTGSARSIPGVNLYMALSRCEDLFIRFGGHSQAAGLTLEKRYLDEFKQRVNEAIAELAEPDAFIPSAAYDMNMQLRDASIPLIEELNRLAPTGFGNPAPVFLVTGAQVVEARSVGVEGKHLKLRIAQGDALVSGIAFSQGDRLAGLPDTIDALFSLSVNEYMGKRSAQCEIYKILPATPLQGFRASCAERADAFECALLEQVQRQERNRDAEAVSDGKVRKALIKEALDLSCQGTLLLARTLEGANAWLDW